MEMNSLTRSSSNLDANNGWDDALTRQVRVWQTLLNDRANAHEAATIFFRRCNMLMTVPNVICSTMLGSMGITDFSGPATDNDYEARMAAAVHRYYTGILAVIVAVLTALDSMLQFNVTAAAHRASARNYSKLVTTIDSQLIHIPIRRENAEVFIEKLVSQMENLKDHAPVLPNRILKKFPSLQPRATPQILTDSENGSGGVVNLV
jgi:hypothetical protein